MRSKAKEWLILCKVANIFLAQKLGVEKKIKKRNYEAFKLKCIKRIIRNFRRLFAKKGKDKESRDKKIAKW